MNKTTDIDFYKLYKKYTPAKSNTTLFDDYVSLTDDEDASVESVRNSFNKLIIENYANEAVVKHFFVKQVCLNKKNASAVTIFELKSNSSRGDLCTINGHSRVYEIKTEFDSFNRLDSQIGNYSLTFDFTYVILAEKHVKQALKILPRNVGIYTYKHCKNGLHFSLFRSGKESKSLCPKTQLEQMPIAKLRTLSSSLIEKSKTAMISELLFKYSPKEVNRFFKDYYKSEYMEKWGFIVENHDRLFPLDFQWFFKNPISPTLVYF